MTDRPPGEETGASVILGIAGVIGANLVLIGLLGPLRQALGVAGDWALLAIAAIGLTQLIYVVPAWFVLRSKGRRLVGQGVIIGAAITALINAACFGFVMYTFRNY